MYSHQKNKLVNKSCNVGKLNAAYKFGQFLHIV